MISEDIMQLLKDNLSFADKTIQAFSDLDYIITNQIPLQKVDCYELYELLFQVKSNLEHYESIKSQKVYISENRDSYKRLFVMVNLEYVKKVFTEILMNAYKFSRSDSSITILINFENKQFEIMYLSSPFLNEGESFPDNFETIVFNPFYRFNNVVYDLYNTLDFCLGLTYVDKIIKKHNGKIKISKIMDHTDLKMEEDEKIKLSVSVFFPVV
jgi:signal transduction histidine kinase